MTDRRVPTVCWDCHEPEGHLAFCTFASKPKEPPSLARKVLWAAALGLVAGAFAAMFTLGGCATPSQELLDKAAQHTLTGTRIAACVESVLAEEEQARALAHRLRETAAELEADRIRSAAREPSSSTAEAVNSVLKDGAKD